MIVGDLVYLTALDPENAEQTRAWLNDRAVARWWIDELVPNSRADQVDFYEEAEKSDKTHVFEIHVREDDRYIGLVGFDDVDLRHRMAEWGIAIGPEDERGKGYGRDAAITSLRWGFDVLGLHTTWLGAVEDNERAIGLYHDLGFKDAGRLREFIFVDGVFRDAVLMDMLVSEFRERYGEPE